MLIFWEFFTTVEREWEREDPKDLKVIESNVFSQVAFVCDLPEGVIIIKEEAYEYCFPRDFYVYEEILGGPLPE